LQANIADVVERGIFFLIVKTEIRVFSELELQIHNKNNTQYIHKKSRLLDIVSDRNWIMIRIFNPI
jgi:hypothetical protein